MRNVDPVSSIRLVYSVRKAIDALAEPYRSEIIRFLRKPDQIESLPTILLTNERLGLALRLLRRQLELDPTINAWVANCRCRTH